MSLQTPTNPVGTPMEPDLSFTKEQSPSTPKKIADIKGVNAVDSLMYLTVATCPDISYTVGVLTRFNSNPGLAHWGAVKHLFRYLKGTLDLTHSYILSKQFGYL